METKTIRQSVLLGADSQTVYDALMQSKRHAAFTGSMAKIGAKVGGRFTAYDGYISGVNVELKPGERIVQAWRSKGWPEGHYSLVAIVLSSAGSGRTRLSFTQIGVPASDFEDKTMGWKAHYWRPLKKYLES